MYDSVTLEEALNNNDNELRQRYINHLSSKMPSPFVDKIVYDPLGLHASRVLSQKEIIEAKKMKMVTVCPSENIGDKVKSTIYVGEKTFKREAVSNFKMNMEQGDAEINIPLTEGILLGYFRHEYQHAEDFYNGMTLGSGFRIDNSNFRNIDLKTFKFVLESRGYIEQLNYHRNQNDQKGYIATLILFGSEMFNPSKPVINLRNLTLYESGIIQIQLNEIAKAAPRLLQFVWVDDFYKNFYKQFKQ